MSFEFCCLSCLQAYLVGWIDGWFVGRTAARLVGWLADGLTGRTNGMNTLLPVLS